MRPPLPVLAAGLLLGACDAPAARPPVFEPASRSPSGPAATAPAPTSSAASGPRRFEPPSARALPGVDQACQRDDDCAVFDDVLAGETACCPGCTQQVGSRASVTRFREACAASPAPMCPPLGCAMPTVTVRCVSGACAASR